MHRYHSATPSKFLHPYGWQTAMSLAILLLLLSGFSGQVQAQPATCANLLVDSSLEHGTGWVAKSNGQYAMLSTVQAHSGVRAAYLAGADNADDLLSTKLSLPITAQSITLNFWWKVNSEDEGDINDRLTVFVADSSGKTQTALLTLASDSASNRWQQSSLELTPWAGDSILLQFSAQTDETSITDFFIDDVTVINCGAK